ncbi:transposase [Agarivorans sp. TSD2052]|uniref:transposase n=1 Tax=Agarivorans sp. TSD2052 TaxID=2937286 RepID=UPI00200EB99B|nr:transposase [Agarivorans sp. TSD2052]UPW17505.1 transposase [Agarivorans sp. TSD2052]
MTRARDQQICLDSTPYYHCICRCVRRAYLCGEDRETGASFEHRKQWIVDKFTQLAQVFSVEVCAYAVMSNHYHLVLRVNQKQAEQWSYREINTRWKQLFAGHNVVEQYLSDPQAKDENYPKSIEKLEDWRKRLFDISWFMRCLNEHIARQANKEEQCKGRFWEGRFKSQALLDEAAVLACMAYVDLNPVRAQMADTPEESDFTSVQLRMQALKTAKSEENLQPSTVLPFSGYKAHGDPSPGLPFNLYEYLELVDWTGRCVRADKRGAIPANILPIMTRLNINQKDWLSVVKDFNRHFISAAGSNKHLQQHASQTGRRWYATHSKLQLCDS